MAVEQLDFVLRHLRHLNGARVFDCLCDGQLLERFLKQRDEEAFVTLLRRHGPMVLGVCRRLLGPGPDAEDAFQATFFVLVGRARSLDRRGSLGAWLYGVAQRISTRARSDASRRRARERQVSATTPQIYRDETSQHDLRPLLDSELARLPLKYRAPLILCYLEGKTHEQAAHELGWPTGSMSRRLARGRELLHNRLAQRGVTLSAAALGVALTQATAPAAVPIMLGQTTLKVALALAAGKLTVGAVSFHVAKLAGKLAPVLWLTKAKVTVFTLVVATLVASGAGVAMMQTPGGNTAFSQSEETSKSNRATQQASLIGDDQKRTPQNRPTPPTHEEKQADPLLDDAEHHFDSLGDPLPAGALARMGTTRMKLAERPVKMVFSPNGELLALVGIDANIRIWKVPLGKEISKIQLPADVGFSDKGEWAGSVAFSPDNKLLATSEGHFWDVTTGKEAGRFPPSKSGYDLLSIDSDNGTMVSAGQFDGQSETLQKIEISTGKVTKKAAFKLPSRTKTLAISGNGKLMAAAINLGSNDPKDPKGGIALIDVDSGKVVSLFLGHYGEVSSLVFSPDGKSLATGSRDRTIHTWDVATVMKERGGSKAKPAKTFKRHAGTVLTLAYTSDGSDLVSVGEDNVVFVWNARTEHIIREIRFASPKNRGPGLLALSPNGKLFALYSFPGEVHVWSTDDGTEYSTRVAGHQSSITAVSFAPDGNTLVTTSLDGTLRHWDASSGIQLHKSDETAKPLYGLGYDTNGHALAAAGNEVFIWEGKTGKRLQTLAKKQSSFQSVAYTPSAKLLATARLGGSIELLNSLDLSTVHELQRKRIGIIQGAQCVAFSPDGRFVAAGTTTDRRSLLQEPDGLIAIWNTDKGHLLQEVGGHPRLTRSGVTALVFSFDAKSIAYIEDRRIYLSDWITGKDTRCFLGHEGAISCIALSHDGRLLASAGQDGIVRVWETASAMEIRQYKGHQKPVTSLTFSPDDKRLVSASADTTALVWAVHAPIKLEKPSFTSLTPKDATEVNQLWTELGSLEAPRAFQGQSSLMRRPDLTVPFFKIHIHKVNEPGKIAIDRLITDLGSELPWEWDEARLKLMALGEIVEEPIRMAIKKKPPPEVRERMQDVLTALKDPASHLPSPDELRQLRAIAVLEHIGTAEAKQTLKDLATGYANARLTREAQESLNRLTKMR